MTSVDVLHALPPIESNGVRFIVDKDRPVAAIVSDGGTRIVTWPDAPLPPLATSTNVIVAPNAVWVVYTEESELLSLTSAPRSSAVRVGVDGRTWGIDLGQLVPIGADADGLWATLEPFPGFGDGEDESGVADPMVDIDMDAPIEEDDDDQTFSQSQSECESDDTTDPDCGEVVWVAGRRWDDKVPPLPPPPAPVPTGPVVLHRFRPDGSEDVLHVDRLVSRVEAIGDRLRLVYHPTGSIQTLDPDEKWYSHTFPMRAIDLDVSDGLPSAVAVDDQPSMHVEDETRDAWDLDADDLDTPDTSTAIDLSGVLGTRWVVRPRDPGEIEAAVDAVRDQFIGRSDPDLIWRRSDDRWHRVRSAYRDIVVTTEGDWPDTEVVFEFHYRRQGEVRLRHHVRVFDAAGRDCASRYTVVYLEERLDTENLSLGAAAVDRVVDV